MNAGQLLQGPLWEWGIRPLRALMVIHPQLGQETF